jgi:predicted type IV restriction endonuclease
MKIFDPIRKVDVKATPEEKVRQALIQWFLKAHKIPLECMEVEFPVSFFHPTAQGRLDILVNKKGRPWMVVEVKHQGIDYGNKESNQIIRYAKQVGSPYVLWSNGVDFLLWKYSQGIYCLINEFPKFS